MSAPDDINADERRRMIAEAAYFRAERRGFQGGDPLSDWASAEIEIDHLLAHSDNFRFLDRLDRQLESASVRLGELKSQLKGLKASARSEAKAEVERLAELRDRYAAKLQEIREQGGCINQRVKHQTEKIWNELTDSLAKLGDRGRD